MDKPFQSILFLSTGRTGTKFLASILKDSIPNADVFHEAGERSRMVNILSHAYLAGLVPERFLIAAWKRRISGGLLRAQDTKDLYIDANNHIYQIVFRRPDLYPGLKVIHIVRDPRSYIRSHLNWSRGRAKSFIANYLTPFWQPTGVMVGEMGRNDWLMMDKFERFAWVWAYKNKFINQFENSVIPYYQIRFEDLFSAKEPARTYLEILNFIGLEEFPPSEDYFQRSINASNKGAVPDWHSWTDDLCKRINDICGVMMQEYGYGDEPAWLEKIKRAEKN